MKHNQAHGLLPISTLYDDPLAGPVIGEAITIEAGEEIDFHWHDYAQLVYTVSGAMTVTTQTGFWVVPPKQAVWIPPMEGHSFRINSPVHMRSLYLAPMILPEVNQRCFVLQVSPLLAALTQKCIGFTESYEQDSPHGRLVSVLLDEIQAAPTSSTYAPIPKDPRLASLAKRFLEHPGDNRTLEEISTTAGASRRTLARLFRRDTGMSFSQWRQQIRLSSSLQMLTAGKPVNVVAEELGYDSTSAFICMFRRHMGTTPGQYLPTP